MFRNSRFYSVSSCQDIDTIINIIVISIFFNFVFIEERFGFGCWSNTPPKIFAFLKWLSTNYHLS